MAKFCAGDFIKKKTASDFSFAIFEGNDVSTSYAAYYKEYSLLAFYDSRCWDFKDGKWDFFPQLKLQSTESKMETCDSLYESYFWGLCTPEEKERALEILKGIGYSWDEKTLSLKNITSNTEVCRCSIISDEYDGTLVTPSDTTRRGLIRKCLEAKKMSPSYNYYDYY